MLTDAKLLNIITIFILLFRRFPQKLTVVVNTVKYRSHCDLIYLILLKKIADPPKIFSVRAEISIYRNFYHNTLL